jgi:hypothetical protein
MITGGREGVNPEEGGLTKTSMRLLSDWGFSMILYGVR